MTKSLITKKKRKVYLFYCINRKLFKIGMSYNPELRCRELSAGKSQLVVISEWEVDNARTVEKELHQTFQHVRRYGEWFELSAIDLVLLHSYFDEDLMKRLEKAATKFQKAVATFPRLYSRPAESDPNAA